MPLTEDSEPLTGRLINELQAELLPDTQRHVFLVLTTVSPAEAAELAAVAACDHA